MSPGSQKTRVPAFSLLRPSYMGGRVISGKCNPLHLVCKKSVNTRKMPSIVTRCVGHNKRIDDQTARRQGVIQDQPTMAEMRNSDRGERR